MKQFITVEEAREQILGRLPRLAAERVLLSQARGRILAESITAAEDSPRFDNSARDGYALRAADLVGERPSLRVAGSVSAGEDSQLRVEAGQAVRIMTGAPVPQGADTIVMQEHCQVDPGADTITITEPVERGAWVRHAGQNMARGQVVLEPGSPLGPAEIGLLASFGRSVLSVASRPTVAIVSTGDELVEIDQDPGPGQIINSNAYMLEALADAHGADSFVLPIAPDEPEAVKRAFGRAIARADLVVSSGGVSVGDFDVTRDIVEELTGGMDFWKIRMKPGKPLAFGLADTGHRSVPLIGLPGNPVSCFVCFHQFVRPALAVMQGIGPDRAPLERVRATIASSIETTARRRTYLSGELRTRGEAAPVFAPADNQNSGNVAVFCQANAFGIVEEGVSRLEAGDQLDVELL